MDFMKSNNTFVNTLLFPGHLTRTTYNVDTYVQGREELESLVATKQTVIPRTKLGVSLNLKLLFVPFKRKYMSCADLLNAPGAFVPCVLAISDNPTTQIFCIHFHGNACDNGQVGVCAIRESYAFTAHYLLVEYPSYGIVGGFPSESIVNAVARSVYDFVVEDLRVPSSQIVIIGRSVGCGPACYLGSLLEQQYIPSAVVVLQSPFTSIRDTAEDLLGFVSWFMLDRGVNWRKLSYAGRRLPPRLLTPAAAAAVSETIKNPLQPEEKKEDDKENENRSSPTTPSSNSNSNSNSNINLTPDPKDSFWASLKASWCCSFALCPEPEAVIRSPVLLIHADQDQIIDHHHSTTLHALRLRDRLPSTLYTQVSSKSFIKDHNNYDYDADVIEPTREFLLQHIDYGNPTLGIALPLDVVIGACAVPPTYQHGPFRHAPNPTDAKDPPTPTVAATAPAPYTPPTKYTLCLCLRCALCCPACFCAECSVAILAKAARNVYYGISGEDPPFQYATRVERKKSWPGGKAVEAETEMVLRKQQQQQQSAQPPKTSILVDVINKLLRRPESAARIDTTPVENPLSTARDVIPVPVPISPQEPPSLTRGESQVPTPGVSPQRRIEMSPSGSSRERKNYVPG